MAGAEGTAAVEAFTNQDLLGADGGDSNATNEPISTHANTKPTDQIATDLNADIVLAQFQQGQPQPQPLHRQILRSQTMPEKKNSSIQSSPSSPETATDPSPTASAKVPFSAGSLLQQQVEAERQQVEMMKLQLKLREQAGVLGALKEQQQQLPLSATSSGPSVQPNPSTSTPPTLSSSNSANSRIPQTTLIQPDPPKYGGPGTLIELREKRAAEMERAKRENLQHLQAMARSQSGTLIQLDDGAGLSEAERNSCKPPHHPHPGLLYGQHQQHQNQQYGRQRTESSGRGLTLVSASSSPANVVSYTSSPALTSGSSLSTATSSSGSQHPTNGSLLRFDQEEKKEIRPGLLLDRAKSPKANLTPSSSSIRHHYQQQQADYPSMPPRSFGTHAPPLLGYGFGGGTGPAPPPIPSTTNSSANARGGGPNGPFKPLVDLGELNGNREILGHGLLAIHQQKQQQQHGSQKAARKPGPLISFA